MSSENFWPHLISLDLCKDLANNWQNDCQSVSFCMYYCSHVYGSVISMSGSCLAYRCPLLLSQQIQLMFVVEFVGNRLVSLTWLSGTGRCGILGHLFFLSRSQVSDLFTFFAGFQRDVCYGNPPKWQVITFMVFNWPQKMTKSRLEDKEHRCHLVKRIPAKGDCKGFGWRRSEYLGTTCLSESILNLGTNILDLMISLASSSTTFHPRCWNDCFFMSCSNCFPDTSWKEDKLP